jgi:hypothetical protein
MALVKLTKEILFQGRSIMGGYSQAQLMLFGVVGRETYDVWGKQILGKEYPKELIDQFIAAMNTGWMWTSWPVRHVG